MKKLIYVSAPWCGPCKMFGPIMDQVASSGVTIEKIDADSSPDILTKYGVRNIPTVIKVDASGNMVDKFTGVKNAEEVMNFYNS